jgi:hypothetical protein
MVSFFFLETSFLSLRCGSANNDCKVKVRWLGNWKGISIVFRREEVNGGKMENVCSDATLGSKEAQRQTFSPPSFPPSHGSRNSN